MSCRVSRTSASGCSKVCLPLDLAMHIEGSCSRLYNNNNSLRTVHVHRQIRADTEKISQFSVSCVFIFGVTLIALLSSGRARAKNPQSACPRKMKTFQSGRPLTASSNVGYHTFKKKQNSCSGQFLGGKTDLNKRLFLNLR